jgi:hypothetical protein
MKWVSRGIGLISGALTAYWSGLGSGHSDWWLWGKFMVVSLLAFEAGQLYREAQLKNN